MSRRSQILSLLLRHQPEIIGISLDSEGWVSVEELLLKLQNFDAKGGSFTLEEIQNIVATSDKKRFSFSEDSLSIRAEQGHSNNLNINIQYEKKNPDQYLYHGTAGKNLNDIMEKGLLPMSRQFVHLSEQLDTATAVGKRYTSKTDTTLIFQIDVFSMIEKGYEFYLSKNNVWLTKTVPFEFINIIEPEIKPVHKFKP